MKDTTSQRPCFICWQHCRISSGLINLTWQQHCYCTAHAYIHCSSSIQKGVHCCFLCMYVNGRKLHTTNTMGWLFSSVRKTPQKVCGMYFCCICFDLITFFRVFLLKTLTMHLYIHFSNLLKVPALNTSFSLKYKTKFFNLPCRHSLSSKNMTFGLSISEDLNKYCPIRVSIFANHTFHSVIK